MLRGMYEQEKFEKGMFAIVVPPCALYACSFYSDDKPDSCSLFVNSDVYSVFQ